MDAPKEAEWVHSLTGLAAPPAGRHREAHAKLGFDLVATDYSVRLASYDAALVAAHAAMTGKIPILRRTVTSS